MPTPFTHLEIAQRLLKDEHIPYDQRAFLSAHSDAFLLGSIAADARVGSGMPREHTHFYHHRHPIIKSPWLVMVEENPDLLTPHSPDQRAFVAGYVAHLSVDEHWAMHMLAPNFVGKEWRNRSPQFKFYMLHIILIVMDERDLSRLESWQYERLMAAKPNKWARFISDNDLSSWQHTIAKQLHPEGKSLTLDILGKRVIKTPEEMRELLDSEPRMHDSLWQYIPKSVLADVELGMYDHARAQMLCYLRDSIG
ncbi:MAG: zinc dependent phospholipase C family protein [bacterium]|nr:zinc dependent phospholipase C family protein [bacterium]